MPRYTTASDTVTEIKSNAIRAGLGRRPPIRIPGKWAHAVDGEATLCGATLAGLRAFPDMAFETVNPYYRCRDCDERAGHPSAGDTPTASPGA